MKSTLLILFSSVSATTEAPDYGRYDPIYGSDPPPTQRPNPGWNDDFHHLNQTCSADSMFNEAECVDTCDMEFVSCLSYCKDEDTAAGRCIRTCSDDQEECRTRCPCHAHCTDGCPCKSYECKSCEVIHPIGERNECNDKCLANERNCRQDCDLFDLECHEGCLNIVYGCCVKDCPCSNQDEAVCDESNIQFNISSTWPALSGYTMYLNKPASELFTDTSFLPPPEAKKILITCGNTSWPEFEVAAVMNPDELFHPIYYSVNRDTYARETRNFYTYYQSSSSYGKTFGFSANEKIHLKVGKYMKGYYDQFDEDCSTSSCDTHRLSVITYPDSDTRGSLARCGRYTWHNYWAFDELFSLIMYYK